MPYNTPEKKKAYREKNRERLNEWQRVNYQNNKEVWKERSRIWRENNKEKDVATQKLYCQTPAGIKSTKMASWRFLGVNNVNDEMYERYINTTKCDVCSKVFSSSKHKHLDHDHDSGEFRWVLCASCNTYDSWKKKI